MALLGFAFITPAALSPAAPIAAPIAPSQGPISSAASFGTSAVTVAGALAVSAVVLRAARGRRGARGARLAVRAAKASSYKDFKDPWLDSADFGFDPLNLAVGGGVFDKGPNAVPETTYYNYRESEVKHGRFAMIAFLAIFFEAADRGALFAQLGFKGAEDRLDGTLGLDEVQAPVLAIGLGVQALAEFNLQKSETDGDILSVEYKKDRIPGNLGFDPLGFKSQGGDSNVKGLHNFEINFGRLAMIGITSFLFKEFVVKDPQIASKIL